MTDERITATLVKVDSAVNDILQITVSSVSDIKQGIRKDCICLREDISMRVSVVEIRLTREIVILTHDADYHLLRAYHHASPSLIGIVLAIYGFIKTVIEVVGIINTILKVTTSEDLAYWIDKLIPGFEAAWDNLMNKISEVSAALGWGVDGVLHLMNMVNMGVTVRGAITGKDSAWVKSENYQNLKAYMGTFSTNLEGWQKNPGQMIAQWGTGKAEFEMEAGRSFISNLVTKLNEGADKVETVVKGLGDMTNEFMSLRNDMPAFVAKNIPQALWDAVGWADTRINDYLLPALYVLSDRIDEVDALLEAHRKKAEALADKIAHPGDMLAEINSLPDYARVDQLTKIDSVTSTLLREGNEAEFTAIEPDLRAFGIIAEALTHAPAPLAFMELELPGRSPGIVAEPRETWMVGDF